MRYLEKNYARSKLKYHIIYIKRNSFLILIVIALVCLICMITVVDASDMLTNTKTISEKYLSFFEKSSGNIVNLRRSTSEDLETLRKMIIEGDLARFLGNGTEIVDVEELTSLDEKNIELVIENENKDIVGQITLSNGSDEESVNLGYWIGKSFRGKGYAFYAIKNVIDNIWGSDETVKFEFWIDDKNIASIGVLNKVSANLKDGCTIEKHSHVIETTVTQSKDNPNEYTVNTYYDGNVIDTCTITKECLLILYSQEKIDNCANVPLAWSSVTQYVIKNILNLKKDSEPLHSKVTDNSNVEMSDFSESNF